MVFGNNRLRPILHGQCFVPRHLKMHVANSNDIITMYSNTINKHLCMVANVTSYFSCTYTYHWESVHILGDLGACLLKKKCKS